MAQSLQTLGLADTSLLHVRFLFWFRSRYPICMQGNEVYPNPSIVQTAVEIKHDRCEPLDSSQRSVVSNLLREALPLAVEEMSIDFEFHQPDGESLPVPHPLGFPAYRWVSRDRRTAATFQQDSVLLETTDYQGYSSLRPLVELVLKARARAGEPNGVERIGLRYVDEIRVPDFVDSEIDWSPWVDSSLLGPRSLDRVDGLSAIGTQGISMFQNGRESILALRYGPGDGFAIESKPNLRRPMGTPGPFFLLDIDSFWQASSEVPEWSTTDILERVDCLHAPIRLAFEELITDRLRNEVLRHG